LVDSWLERLQIEQEAFIPADFYYYSTQHQNKSIIIDEVEEVEGTSQEHRIEVIDSNNL
jgi:hypothetical protein